MPSSGGASLPCLWSQSTSCLSPLWEPALHLTALGLGEGDNELLSTPRSHTGRNVRPLSASYRGGC